MIKKTSKSKGLEPLVQELTLMLARNHRALEALHVLSEWNKGADLLSRMAEPGQTNKLPESLRDVCLVVPPERMNWSVLCETGPFTSWDMH